MKNSEKEDICQLAKELAYIFSILRSDKGCPWDRKQTHLSLRKYVYQEALELISAIEQNDIKGIKEELADLLLQIYLHSQIAKEQLQFSVEDVFKTLKEKIIRRHPHVFSNVKVSDSNEVVSLWQNVKAKERELKGSKFILDEIIFDNLDQLDYALRIQEKVKEYNFEFRNFKEVKDKFSEELDEFFTALKQGENENIQEEAGDVLFAFVNLLRWLKIHPSLVLYNTNFKFKKRFFKMEKLIKSQDKNIKNLSINELDELWEKVKREEK